MCWFTYLFLAPPLGVHLAGKAAHFGDRCCGQRRFRDAAGAEPAAEVVTERAEAGFGTVLVGRCDIYDIIKSA